MKKIYNEIFTQFTEEELLKLKKRLREKKEVASIFNGRFYKQEFNSFLTKLYEINIENLKPLFTEEEINDLKEALLKENIKFKFDGKLKEEELNCLKEAHVSEKNIEKIKFNLNKYKNVLESFTDLVGDTKVPDPLFFNFLLEHFGYLLNNDPDLIYTKENIEMRKKINFLIKKFGKLFLMNPQIIENRNFLKSTKENPKKCPKDDGIVLPNEPVIWTSNHGFKDDILASILASKRYTCLVLASLPQFFNTLDGLTAWINGVILFNRKVNESRASLLPKANKVMDLGADLLLFGEGVHNKTPNLPLIEIWPGIYRLAKERGCKIVPLVHYIKDPTCKMPFNPIHTVIDDPIRIDDLSEKAALTFLRDILATWHQLMNEKYGKMTREELLNWYQKRAMCYTDEDFTKRKISTHEAFEIYLQDLNSTVERYDKEIETNADYRSKEIVRDIDVFQNIANIKNSNYENVSNIIEASTKVRTRKMEDYQRRF